jgi:hypothetical protein
MYAAIFNCNGNKIALFLHAFSNTVEKGASRQKSRPKPENSQKNMGLRPWKRVDKISHP